MADDASIDIGESIVCEYDQPNRIWDQNQRAFFLGCKKAIVVHAEMIGGGGGGGGGGGNSNKGGTGGGAGEYSNVELTLSPGQYRIIVGAGGAGGESDPQGTPDPAGPGGDSTLSLVASDFVYARGKGGAAGKYGGNSSQLGANGGGVTNDLGQILSSGGAGGKADRPGMPGTVPGGGSGGCGVFVGGGPYRSADGSPGRVTITRVS